MTIRGGRTALSSSGGIDSVTGINPHSPLPKYTQLRGILLEMLATELEVDDPIPSERELQERFGLSRMTVRKTVDQLVADGALYRVAGRGTFVSSTKANVQLRLSSFSEDMIARGMRPTQRTLRLEEMPAPAYLAHHLQIPEGDPMYLLERIRCADGRAVCVERSHMPARLLPGLIEKWEDRSLYGLLAQHYSLRPNWSEQQINATSADQDAATALEVAPGSPLLTIRQRAHHQEQVVEYCITSYRPDRYELSITLNRPGVAAGSTPTAQATGGAK
ncbi:GntR family transcriptional regulator [Streptomyces sp. NPDC005799]|uniref:GntR family transcriptional regulator n=1 Tax=Streptomyces sp. NPDC005799 TaxID=3154678 RepID=UPI0033C43580